MAKNYNVPDPIGWRNATPTNTPGNSWGTMPEDSGAGINYGASGTTYSPINTPALTAPAADTSAGDQVSTFGKLASVVPVVGTVINAATSIISTIMNYGALKDQAAEQRRLNDQSISLYKEGKAQEQNQFLAQNELANKTLTANTKLANKKLDMDKEAQEYNKRLTFADSLRGYFFSQPAFRDRALNLAKQRAV